jgi:hypothetical protein
MSRAWILCRKYAFALVPAIGLFELALHWYETWSVPTEAEWQAARAEVQRIVEPADLVIFAPQWVEPLAREYFGPELASIQRIARPDESRFPRAIEVSIRGAHRTEIANWKRVNREKIGRFEVTTSQNPDASSIVDDLVDHVRPDAMTVSLVDGGRETACPWTRGPVLTGGLGYGPTVPADRFACAGGAVVAVTVISDPTYQPRRCIYAPPVGGNAVLRLRFASVAFGTTLHGHHAIAAEADHANGAPVEVAFRTEAEKLGDFVRRDGTGWTPFEATTNGLAGTKAELVVDIRAARGDRRQYCFEADTR